MQTVGEEQLDRIYRRTTLGIKPGLDATRALFARLHLPLKPFPLIHIAGTNGKGSVAAMIESVLRTSGLRTGLFTSPHLLRFHERFRIDGCPCSDDMLSRCLQEVEDAAAAHDRSSPERPITFFELTTALGVLLFLREKVDVAIIETGLGGRLDSTNVLQPVLSVLTRVGIDHTEWLGTSLEQIAAEKAGIMKPGVPVVCAVQEAEVQAVFTRIARERGCPLLPVDDIQIGELEQGLNVRLQLSSAEQDYGRISFPLRGRFQYENLAAALRALEELASLGRLEWTPNILREGLSQVRWPGRLELLREEPPLILDCAHNPQGMKVFLEWCQTMFKKRKLGILFACMGDKDVDGLLRAVAESAERVWLCRLPGSRACAPEVLAERFSVLGIATEIGDFSELLMKSEDWQKQTDGVVGVAGSIVLAGICLQSLNLDS